MKKIFYPYGDRILAALLTGIVLILAFYSIRLSTLGLPLAGERGISKIKEEIKTFEKKVEPEIVKPVEETELIGSLMDGIEIESG